MGRLAFVLVLIGAGAYLMYDNRAELSQMVVGAPPAATRAAPATPGTDSGGRTITLRAGDGGHFFVTADVDGIDLPFVVDTGATSVALTPEAGKRLGLHIGESDLTIRVRTANGIARAAPVRLRQIRIGQLTVYDVDAMVLERGGGPSLLGMNFLRRLDGYEVRGDTLLLHW